MSKNRNVTDENIYKMISILLVGLGVLIQMAMFAIRTDSHYYMTVPESSAVKIVPKDPLMLEEIESQIKSIKIHSNQACNSASLTMLISMLSIGLGLAVLIALPTGKSSGNSG